MIFKLIQNLKSKIARLRRSTELPSINSGPEPVEGSRRLATEVQNFSGLSFLQFFRGRRRGRLVRHYFFISVLLIGSGLIISGVVEIYFRYQESIEHLALLQQEVTAGAAFKIERFIQEIQRTMKGATRSREIAPKGLTPEYRFELRSSS